ncbi:MAG: FtsB family cell division protein [Bdellovibrionia bacterium]
MNPRLKHPLTIHQKWLIFFGIWSLILSGVGSRWIGPPGVWQALELQGLFKLREMDLKTAEAQKQALEQEILLLEKNRFVQEREIRRTLGYSAADELIFEFTD